MKTGQDLFHKTLHYTPKGTTTELPLHKRHRLCSTDLRKQCASLCLIPLNVFYMMHLSINNQRQGHDGTFDLFYLGATILQELDGY